MNAGAAHRVAADAVLLLHLAFVIFVILGAAFAPHWPKIALLHIPATAWAAFVELSGHVCPLTPLEVSLRTAAGDAGYAGGFIDHYVIATLYPAGLTRSIQVLLGAAVVAVNAAVYAVLFLRWRRARLRSYG